MLTISHSYNPETKTFRRIIQLNLQDAYHEAAHEFTEEWKNNDDEETPYFPSKSVLPWKISSIRRSLMSRWMSGNPGSILSMKPMTASGWKNLGMPSSISTTNTYMTLEKGD